jgi:coproporphyrinogen III oxidase
MMPLDDQQQAARDWFESLRTRICEEFEAIEREADSDARFEFIPWERTDEDGTPGGGGVRGQMAGKIFEKVGVNVSTVGGEFSREFAAQIPGAEDDPRFFATGISLVAHMANPHVPAGPHEHAVPVDHAALVRRRGRSQSGHSVSGRHRRLPCADAGGLRRT